jgi:hypothetical protein
VSGTVGGGAAGQGEEIGRGVGALRAGRAGRAEQCGAVGVGQRRLRRR